MSSDLQRRLGRRAEIPLSALGGGEGRGEVGEPPVPNSGVTHLTLPTLRVGPLPLPRRAGGEGQKGRESHGYNFSQATGAALSRFAQGNLPDPSGKTSCVNLVCICFR